MNSYDAIATEYARHFQDELAHKPMDRALLNDFVGRRRLHGPIADLGCGPGHVAAHMKSQGADVVGIDNAPAMLDQARARHPDITFEAHDMVALPQARFSGIVAFYVFIHADDATLAAALGSCHAALIAGGQILAAVHLGEGSIHRTEMFGIPVDLTFRLFAPGALDAALESAGFEIIDSYARDAIPDAEYLTRRAYIRARKSA